MSQNPPDSCSWYVALVRSGHESEAQTHLMRSGFDETFCLRRRSSALVRGKLAETLLPVSRGYVLVRTRAFTPDLWHLAVCGVDHLAYGLVRGFFGRPPDDEVEHREAIKRGIVGGWPPDPVPDEAVSSFRALGDDDGIIIQGVDPPTIFHEPGTVVRVLPGYREGLYDKHTFVVVFDTPHGMRLRAVQGVGYLVYIDDRSSVVPVDVKTGPSAEQQQRRSPRGKGRLFRRARSVCNLRESV